MNQLSFLIEDESINTEDFDYRLGIFNQDECEQYFNIFMEGVPWKQVTRIMWGKPVLTPRLTAWYGDPNSGNEDSKSRIWTPEMYRIKEKVELISGISFNSVLLTCYRNQNDSVAWHSDRDNVLGKNKYVASVSFGQERVFDLRRKNDPSKKFSVLLENGSYLLMKGRFQDTWEHRIAKTRIPKLARVNLTFRTS